MYKFIDSDQYDTMPIQITEGDFADTVFRYHSLEITEEEDGLNISYKFDIIEGSEELREDVKFHELMSATLNTIVEASAKEVIEAKELVDGN
jgi:hypothetical protein|tara:strand:+ start:1600 stop:1875 length:276 start_codon:yes stop_codon:yes gene_type:complete